MDDETDDARPADAARPLGSELSDYQGGMNRKLQVTKRGWNRFDAQRRKTFLKWFAATANAAESARQAGIGYSTVYAHRMADARFAEAWDRALEQSYARLEAKVLQMQFEDASGAAIEFDGSFEPPDSKVVDLTMAMQLLKQHKTEVVRIRAERDERFARRGKKIPSHDRERLASDADMRRALVKSLRAFGVRVTEEALRSQSGGGTPSPQPSPTGEGEE